MTTYKVTYFDAKGRGEIIRLVLSAAGKEFVDERIKTEQWPALKPEVPMSQLPVLSVTKGGKTTVYCQSLAIANSLAKEFGLAGEGSDDQQLVAEVCESVMDVQIATFKFYFDKDEATKAVAKKDVEENQIPRLAKYFGKRRKEFGKNGYLIGSKLSLADLAIFNYVDQSSGMGFVDAWAKFPDVAAHTNKVKEDKKLAVWLAKRPSYNFNL